MMTRWIPFPPFLLVPGSFFFPSPFWYGRKKGSIPVGKSDMGKKQSRSRSTTAAPALRHLSDPRTLGAAVRFLILLFLLFPPPPLHCNTRTNRSINAARVTGTRVVRRSPCTVPHSTIAPAPTLLDIVL